VASAQHGTDRDVVPSEEDVLDDRTAGRVHPSSRGETEAEDRAPGPVRLPDRADARDQRREDTGRVARAVPFLAAAR